MRVQIGQPDTSSVLLGLGGDNAGRQAVVFKESSRVLPFDL